MKRTKRQFKAGDPVYYWPYGLTRQPLPGVVVEVKYNQVEGFVCLVAYTDSQGRDKDNWILQGSLTLDRLRVRA